MRRLLALAIIIFVTWGMQVVQFQGNPAAGSMTMILFGFLMLSAYLIGDLLPKFKLPKLTGYLMTGIIFGPYLLKILTVEAVTELKFIDDLALTFIAFAAGGELRISDLKARQRSILFLSSFPTLVTFIGVVFLIVIGRSLMPFMVNRTIPETLAIGTIFGVIAVSFSPSTTIAIINEVRARGAFTETVLGVTIALDTLVIILFAVAISFSEAIIYGASVNVLFLLVLCGEILLSIILGVLIGWGFSFYIRRVTVELPILILGMAFLVTQLSYGFSHYIEDAYNFSVHLEPLLICIAAGFFVQNFSPEGEHFLEGMKDTTLPVFIIFFVIVGAGINLKVLEDTWQMAIMLGGVRIILICLGSYLGGRFSGDSRQFNRLYGLGFLSQAGVSLGLANEVVRRFPDWGPQAATLMIAAISLNQMIGPITLKYSLTQVREGTSSVSGG
ncbi:cation:proton antiporter [Candidatus Poribacteria bacterium]|nr:cation:proton antiporter [Candidatus Poribacteria bacterium]